MPNRLATESSPYLRQHAENPVDWYPWGPEALERSRAEDRPVLLSIGYAACHWCHVMAHESFEDVETARLMNELFVNIKVDREERPDLDAIYMQATQAMTGHGGWPMTVFLTPAGAPFYAGTYWPPSDRHGMPSFRRVLASVADAYRDRRDRVEEAAARVLEIYAPAETAAQAPGRVTAQTLELAYRSFAQTFDARHGGFGGAPKFPPTMGLEFLLSYWRRTGTGHALDMVIRTMRQMARGGIYDQVGGGFARYAVDQVWLVPHFEKMLYDNALLVRLGAHLWQATGDAEVRRVVEETLEWVRREMTDPGGGFYSSLDADSEGHEGKFYVWSAAELDAALGADAGIARHLWGVSVAGNFEGQNILHVTDEPSVVASRLGIDLDSLTAHAARMRRTLYDIRATRVWPGRDEKVLAGWNGLMLRGVAEAARAFGSPSLTEMAIRNGEFLRREMIRDESGSLRVMRSWMAGSARIAGFLEDHAAVALAFLDLYALTFDLKWLDDALRLNASILERFWDGATDQLFDTPSDHEALITRPRDVTDNAMPSGTSLAAELLFRLADLTGDAELTRRGVHVLESLAEPMSRHTSAFGHLLGVADLYVHGAVEVVLAGDPDSEDFRALARSVASRFVPSLVLAGGRPDLAGAPALVRDRPAREGAATAYVCRHYLCEAPACDPAEIPPQLDRAVRSPLGVGA